MELSSVLQMSKSLPAIKYTWEKAKTTRDEVNANGASSKIIYEMIEKKEECENYEHKMKQKDSISIVPHLTKCIGEHRYTVVKSANNK